MNDLILFVLLLKASLFSTGGMGNLPSLHNDLLERRWAVEAQFAESLAVGQVAPGPNGLWVISLGYLIRGVPGALLALLAILLPPFLVIPVEKLYLRARNHPAVEGFVHGLSLAVVGIFAVILFTLFQSVGAEVKSIVIGLISFGIGLTRRVPVLLVLLAAAAIGGLWR